jgi:hypothetical protein
MKSFGNFEFLVENGSHSEIEISGCDKLPPLKGISSRDSGTLGLGVGDRKIRFDKIKRKWLKE